MCYVKQLDGDEKRRYGCAPLLGSIIFRGYYPKRVLKEGVQSTREQWQENCVKKLRKVAPA
jgi:hypothetical protein